MGRNRNKKVADIEKVAVWQIKFSKEQAEAFWNRFSSDDGLEIRKRMDYLISKEDFIKAATKGHILIKKNITDMVKDFNHLIRFYLWNGSYNYSTPLDSPYINLRGQTLHGKEIFYAKHGEIFEKGKEYTEITWIEEMLNLVFDE